MAVDTHPRAMGGAPAPGDEVTQDNSADGFRSPGPDDLGGPLPAKLGRYHVLEQLGAGGMGVVLAAYDPDLDRKVALKLLRPDGSAGSSGRLLREAHALARLSHPNVVQIYDTGALDDRIFIAMELVRGTDLRAWLARPRPPAEVLRVFLDAGRGLAAAHDAGFVHRDFKPENVLLGADGRVRVADFGLVRQHDEEPVAASTSSPARGALDRSLTLTGALLGTPAFMSPEQHLGRPADARSDQFSFCVALWEALHGQRPFAGDSAVTITAAVLAGRIEAPRVARAPRYLRQVLERGLASAPEQRYPDMQALLAALARDPVRARRQWLLGLGAAGLLVGAAVALRADVVEPCGGGPDELATAWDPERRQAVVEALAAARDPDSRRLALTGLDAYADAWLASHRDACLDHHRGEQSSALLDARMRCLDRRRQTLATAARVLTSADAGGAGGELPDAAQVVARMPAVGACDDPAVVLGEAAVPEDPVLAAEVASVESLLISAMVQHDAGDVAGALAVADDALARARATQFEPIVARALVVSARIHFTRTAWALARPALAEALARAVEARSDDLAAEAFARLLYIDGVQDGRIAEAMDLAPLALAMAARAPEPHAARGLAHNNIGAVQILAHDRDGALASMRSATAEMTAAPRSDPIERAHVFLNAAIMDFAADERREGLRRAEELMVAHLGRHHLHTLDMLSLAAAFATDLPTGVEQLSGLCPEYLKLHDGAPVTCGFCFHRLAHFELFVAGAARALTSAEQALACRAGLPATAVDDRVRDKVRGFIAIHTGRPLAALEDLARASTRLEPHREVPWVAGEIAEVDLLRGRALLQLDRPADAIVALESTLPIFAAAAADRPELMAPLWLAEARSLLARALLAASPPDPARAAELDAAARAGFMKLRASPP